MLRDNHHYRATSPTMAGTPPARTSPRRRSPVPVIRQLQARGRIAGAISDIHASLRGAAVGTITGSFPPSAWCGSEVAGVVCVFGGVQRSGRKVHSGTGAPPAVTVRSWTVRGRISDWCWSSLPGNPRCRCVRVCQSPVLTGALAGGVLVPIGGGCRFRRWPAHESDVRARRGNRRAQGHDQGRDPVPGRETVDPQDRDLRVPDVLRGAPGGGPGPAPAGCHARGDGG
jgi:hypothetical protein